jgi:HAD superfamily hydrolase (TIGR01450 family)
VIGIDDKFNNYKLATGACLLRANKDILFVATNTDASLPYSDSLDFPGAGSFVAALSTASGRQPDMICGKPSQLLLDYVLDEFKITDRNRVCMVGDRLDTDIMMGNKGRIQTMCVLTGVATEEQLQSLKDEELTPNVVLPSFGDIFKLLQ